MSYTVVDFPMKTKRTFRIFGIVALMFLLIFFAAKQVFAQELSQGRIFTRSVMPTGTLPNFVANRDILIVNGQQYYYSAGWKPVTLIRGEKGDKGDPGATGANGQDGVCPSCPPTSGGSNSWEVTTWAGLIAALQNDNIRAVDLRADITVAGKWRVPANYNRIKVINGNGYKLTIPSTIDTFIVRSYSSLSAANSGIDMQLRIYDLIFQGANNIAIYMEANYGSRIQGCRFYDFKEAISMKWCMGTYIEQNYFWENYISIKLDYARFTGGGAQESQSNHPYLAHNKFRSSSGDYANIQLIAVSGAITYHNIHEGVDAGGADYFVDFNYGGSSTTKDFISESDHIEQSPGKAAYNIRMKEGFPQIKNQFPQKPGTYIRFDSDGAYAKVLVGPFAYVPTGLKFENVNGGRWQFINMPAEFNPATTTNWTGTVPSWSQNGYQTNGQTPFLQGFTIR